MKGKIITIIAALVIITGVSCKKIIASLFSGLEFSVPDMSVSVPAIPFISPSEVQFGSVNQNINLDSIVKSNTANQFGADVVKSVVIKSVTITLTNGDDLNNLSNFESARISLTSNNNSNAIDIANISFPATNSNTYVYIPTSSPELVSYLKGSTLTYTVYGKNRKITTKTLNFNITVRLKVN